MKNLKYVLCVILLAIAILGSAGCAGRPTAPRGGCRHPNHSFCVVVDADNLRCRNCGQTFGQ